MIAKNPEHIIGLNYQEIYHPDVRIFSFPNKEAVAAAAANQIISTAVYIDYPVFQLATGATMEPVYDAVTLAVEAGTAHLDRAHITHLDGRYPMDTIHPSSFGGFIINRAGNPWKVPAERVHIINERAEDPYREADRYEQLLQVYVPDLFVAGVGPPEDPHAAFIGRGTAFGMGVHYIPKLPEAILRRDRVDRGEDVPDGAITVGPKDIARAKHALVIGYEKKGLSLKHILSAPIGPDCPATIFRTLGRDRVTVMIDDEAAQLLQS